MVPAIFVADTKIIYGYNFVTPLMCFDGKNNHLKKTRVKYGNSKNKRMLEVLKIDFVLSDDEIQFLHSLANSNVDCYCSRSALLM